MRHPLLALLASWWLFPALTGSGAEPAPQAPEPLADGNADRTLSESGQFSILGGSPAARSELGKRGDSHWKLFNKTTGMLPQWRHRIIVQIHDGAMAPQVRVVARIYPLPGGFRFQIDLLQDADFRWEEYRRELTRLFLLSETILARPDHSIRDRIPLWMLSGTQTLMSYRQNGVPTEFFRALLNTRQMPSLAEVLKAVPARAGDSVSSGVFSACGATLVQALLEQPNGRVRFQALLGDLGTTETDEQELLRQHFPVLRQEPAELEKWWSQQMTTMSKRGSYAVLSVSETEKQLEEILVVRAPAPASGTASPPDPSTPDQKKPAESKPGWLGWLRRQPGRPDSPDQELAFEPVHLRFHERYLRMPWAKALLGEKRKQLLLLQSQAFPLYEGILAGYQQVLNALHEGRVKGIGEQLDRLEQDRQTVQQQMQGIEDHINWFSTTQIQGTSQEFDGYAQALKLLEKLEQRKRPDPVSRYLDAIERELNP